MVPSKLEKQSPQLQKIVHDDQLKRVQSEIDMLGDHKQQLHNFLKKYKFVKANHRHSRIQDKLKRSEAHVQRLGEQLGFHAGAVANEEDISINILSDEETFGNVLITPNNGSPSNHLVGPVKDQYKGSPSMKRMRVHMVDFDENPKQATGEWVSGRKKYEI